MWSDDEWIVGASKWWRWRWLLSSCPSSWVWYVGRAIWSYSHRQYNRLLRKVQFRRLELFIKFHTLDWSLIWRYAVFAISSQFTNYSSIWLKKYFSIPVFYKKNYNIFHVIWEFNSYIKLDAFELNLRSELSFWTPQEKLPKLLPREYNDFPDDVNESVEDIVSDLCDIKSDIKNISKILLQENILLIHTLII